MKFAFAAVLAACLSARAEERWIRIESPHFELYTDSGAASAREALKRFEQIRHVFVTRAQGRQLTPLPVRIFMFKSEANFRPYQVHPDIAGYYQAGNDRDYIAMQANGPDLYRVVFHEYVHLLLRHAGWNVPVWFNEGTAEVYSTIEMSSSEVRIGELIPAHLATLRTERLLDLPTLLAVDHRSPHYNERGKSGTFYAQSWALTHMLNFSPEYQPGLPNFLEMLLTGEDPSRAFQQAFGKTIQQVTADLSSYFRQDRFAGVRFKTPRFESVGKMAGQPVEPVDAGLLLVDLLLAVSKEREADGRLEKIAEQYPDNPAVQASLGDMALRHGNDDLARQRYERAMQAGNRSGRLRYDYGMLLRELKHPDTEVIARMQEAVELDPQLFDAFFYLGYLHLSAKRYPEAVRYFSRATELQPYSVAVWEYLALCHHHAGERDRARAAAVKARRNASSAEDIDRTESTLRLVESAPDSIVHAPRPERPAEPVQAAARTAGIRRIEGLLTQVDCLAGKARLHVASGGKKTFLLVRDPGQVRLLNAGSVATEFSCAEIRSRPVIVEYRAIADSTYGTAGEVASIEFR